MVLKTFMVVFVLEHGTMVVEYCTEANLVMMKHLV